MTTEHRPNAPDSSDSTTDFRGRDIHYPALAAIVAGLVTLVFVAVGVNWLLFVYFQDRENRQETEASPFRSVERELPSPMIAVDPSGDRLVMEAEMEQLLGIYEWVDPDADRVRIPIERAMEVVAERGGRAVVADLPEEEGPESDGPEGEQ